MVEPTIQVVVSGTTFLAAAGLVVKVILDSRRNGKSGGNGKLLTEIRNDVSEIKDDISTLKTDVAVMKSDFIGTKETCRLHNLRIERTEDQIFELNARR